jgi:hypothetical protein
MKDKLFMCILISAACIESSEKILQIRPPQKKIHWFEDGVPGTCEGSMQTARGPNRALFWKLGATHRLRGAGPKFPLNSNQESKAGAGSAVKATKTWALMTNEKKKEFGELVQARYMRHSTFLLYFAAKENGNWKSYFAHKGSKCSGAWAHGTRLVCAGNRHVAEKGKRRGSANVEQNAND